MKKLFIWFTVFVAAIAAYSYLDTKNSTELLKACYPEVTNIYDSVTINGVVKEKERNNIYVDSPCIVEEVYVKEGEYVHSGQNIFKVKKIENASYVSLPVSLTENFTGELWGDIITYNAADVYIKSPSDGIVMNINCKIGGQVSQIQNLAIISNIDNLQIVSKVNEEMIYKLKEEMDCELSFPAISDKTYMGVITDIMPYAVKSSNILSGKESPSKTEVKSDILNNDGQIRPGYSVSSKITTSIKNNTLVLPYEYIGQGEDNKEFVYVLNKEGRAEKRYIKTGYELTSVTEILNGITKNDVVLTPIDGIENIEKLNIKVKYETN